MQGNNEYRFEKLTEKNIPDLVSIYEDAFKKRVDPDFLNKKQNTSFAGLGYVGFIAYAQDGFPAAFYGVFPCFAEYNGKKYLVAQSGDTMTHSAHTGKGLFTQLALKTYEYCQENGIHLVFGFPNQNSYPGFVKKLGWSHFDDLEAYTIRVKGISWYRLKQVFGLSDALHKKRGSKILNKQKPGNPFPSSCLENDVPVVDHSPAFFDYKTYDKNFLLNVEGVNVWLKFNTDYLLIGDIEKTDEEHLLRVMAQLKKLAFRMFIPFIRFQGSKDVWLTRFFAKHGNKVQITYPVGGVNFSGEIPMEKMKFTLADNDTF